MWGFTKFNLKQMLKVSADYLEKQSLISKKKKIKPTAKIDPKDGVSRPNFQWRFWFCPYTKLCRVSQDLIKGLPKVCMDLWLAHLNRAKNNLVQTKKEWIQEIFLEKTAFTDIYRFLSFPKHMYLVIHKMYSFRL